jgi:TolB protein
MMLQDRVDDSFVALKERVARETGWDFLSNLEAAFVPLTSPLSPGKFEDWLYTGRAFSFNSSPYSAGWVTIVREDYGPKTYWRVFLRTRFQDGTQGQPLRSFPWDFSARLSGDPTAYENGGAPAVEIPAGYWVDFTDLAATYGWERQPAMSSWKQAFSSTEFNKYVLSEGQDWMSAMLEIYPRTALDTYTPVPSPTHTPTITLTPTKTLTPTRTPWLSRTPTLTKTPWPTRTPVPTKTPWPSRTPKISPTPTNTVRPSRTPTPTPVPSYTPRPN